MRDSCWLINYKNGDKVILSELKYVEYKKTRVIPEIATEDHWFIMRQCIEKNPDVEVRV